MNKVGSLLLGKLAESLPRATVLWEREPEPHDQGLHGCVLTADLNGKKLSMKFERAAEKAGAATEEELRDLLVSLDDIVDDFVSFFERSIYRKERFTRIVPC